ncbi:hypothetical protein EZV62_014050 [Acer yangbiense]|uniref:Retrotransposon Copia-like N-terminal domain-containing protein n=1 Tax=Acer yangbiense TaxID=1000413 RepID=A0A5C7HR05_9ROSI|nr:hypothetical protein EZV62_014050 [Acer yangbiense]
MNRSQFMSQDEPTLTKKQRENRSNLISKNLNFCLPIKLNQNNFVYWKAQILPIVRAFDLEELLFGPVISPKKYIEIKDEETDSMIKAISDDCLTWPKQFASTNLDLTNVSANILAKIHRGESTNDQRGGHYHGRARGRGRGRGGGRYNNSRPVCQVCGKIGHTVNVCYHIFDQSYNGNATRQTPPQGNIAHQTDYVRDNSYQVHSNSLNAITVSSSSVADPNWYIDNGATNHITPDFNNLSINSEYRALFSSSRASTLSHTPSMPLSVVSRFVSDIRKSKSLPTKVSCRPSPMTATTNDYSPAAIPFHINLGNLDQTLMAISHITKAVLKQTNKTMESKQMLVLSLGTGEAKKEQKYNAATASQWGLLNWVYNNGKTPLLDVYGDASSDIVDFHVSTLFQCFGTQGNYLRIQEDSLTGDAASMDISTNENMQKLVEIGTNLLKEPVSRVDLETGRFQKIEGEGTNEEALVEFAKLLSEERKLRSQINR